MTGKSRWNDSMLSTEVNFWPAMVDALTTTFMIFVLFVIVQRALLLTDERTIITDQRQSEFKALFHDEFEKDEKTGDIRLAAGVNILQVSFSSNVLFKLNKYDLQTRGKDMLARFARMLKKAVGTEYQQIQVEGHTDIIGFSKTTFPTDNWDLSAARAVSVVRFLINDCGLKPKLISANGYADQVPANPNSLYRDNNKDRRIEIRLYFSLPGEELTQKSQPNVTVSGQTGPRGR